jgi:hypothetical protein
MRVIVQNDPTHPDNMGHIVTHLGMNLDERMKEFKQFENDDQAFWEKVIGGTEPEIPSKVRDGSSRLTAEEQIVVHGQIVDSLWEEDFTSSEDQQIIDDLRERLKLYGLDPDQAEQIVKQSKVSGMKKAPAPVPFAVQPQREWEEARKRLMEQGTRLAKLVLNHVQLDMHGTEMVYKYTSLGISGRSNFIAAVAMVNKEINKRLGKEREAASTEDFKTVLDDLEDILQTVVRRVYKAKSEYEQKNS